MGNATRSNEYWIAKEKEVEKLLEQLEELDNQRKKIMKRLNVLKSSLRYHNGCTSDKTNSEVYKMFGKAKKNLTNEELRIYNTTRQKAHRDIKG